MSVAVWFVIVGFIAFVGIVGMYVAHKREMADCDREAYQRGYREGLSEAWKGQPDPIGRHQGANDLTRLVSEDEARAWPLVMAETLRPELERLYPKGDGISDDTAALQQQLWRHQ